MRLGTGRSFFTAIQLPVPSRPLRPKFLLENEQFEIASPKIPLFQPAAIPIAGGLMPHTLNATLLDQSDACAVLLRSLELGTSFATIGHGLDVLLALGKDASPLQGRKAAVFPNQENNGESIITRHLFV